ncbi:MAG TPA: hypothetical protein VH274_01265 [Mycobacteriales bacterium]|nr:hypothetical protein [Mycobacteriales bacterium]
MNSRFSRSRRKDVPLPSGDPLASLLEDMHDLRMTLAADLTAAAGAADAGAEDVARDIVEADRVELARFARVANIRLERLGRPLPEPVPSHPAWRRRVAVALPVVPVVGAMALSAAAATGILPIPGATHTPKPAVVQSDAASPASSLQQLEQVLAGDPSASQVIAAASKLHRQLRQLIANTPNDPGGAAEIAQLLRMEQSLLLQKQPPGASIVLDVTRKLAARLVTVAPELNTPSVAPTFVPSAPPHSHHPQRHGVSPSPSAKPTPPPAPAPAPSTSANPDPSPSPSDSPIALPQ